MSITAEESFTDLIEIRMIIVTRIIIMEIVLTVLVLFSQCNLLLYCNNYCIISLKMKSLQFHGKVKVRKCSLLVSWEPYVLVTVTYDSPQCCVM